MKSSQCNDKEQIFYIASLAVLLVGGALNITLLLGIVRRIKVCGIYSFVLQILVCDLVTMWIYPLKRILPDFCDFIIGMEILAETATTYCIVAVNFHAVSLHNLALCHHFRELQRRQEHTENLSAVCTQDECTNDESAGNEMKMRRTLTIDYNRMKRSISALLPTISIWLLAASIALPHVLSLHAPENTSNLCCSLAFHISHLKPIILIVVIVFQLAFPTLFYVCGIFFVSLKLTTFQLDLMVCKLAENVKEVLIFSLILTLSYVFVSIHSNTMRFVEITSSPYTIFLTIANSFMPAIRPFIYLITLKSLRRSLMILFIP